MKFGVRKPSLKKSFKAKTTGALKRKAKKAIIPGYGKKGTGWIKDPKKSAYNKVYNKTSIGVSDIVKTTTSKTNSKSATNYKSKQSTLKNYNVSSIPSKVTNTNPNISQNKGSGCASAIGWFLWVCCLIGVFIGPFTWEGSFFTKLIYWIVCVFISLVGIGLLYEKITKKPLFPENEISSGNEIDAKD